MFISIVNLGSSSGRVLNPQSRLLGLLFQAIILFCSTQASDWGTGLQEHQWKTSQIAPFAANVGLVVFKCENGKFEKIFVCDSLELILDFQIMMLQNELIVESQPACGARVCTLAEFSEAYRYLAQVDFDEECRVERERE